MTYQILNIISIVLATIGACSAIVMLRRYLEAEKELSQKLKNKLPELYKSLENAHLDSYRSRNKINIVNVDENKLKEIIEQVKQVVEELPKGKRGEILDALEQKSSRGQIGYLNRLLHLSGSNLNVSAHG